MSATGGGRVLSLDVGKRRIGIAVSDPLGITAQGLPTLERSRIRDDLDALQTLIQDYGVGLLLVGNPLHMSGDAGKQAAYTQEFAERLSEKTGVPVKFWDERLTSVQANRVLRESGIGLEKRKAAVDRLSAVLLLESYLEWRSMTAEASE